MKSGSLDGTYFSFTMSCTDNTKFGITSTGQSTYTLRYVVYYTLADVNVVQLKDPFNVAIINQCNSGTLSLADSARTTTQTVYVADAAAVQVPSISSSITVSVAACTTFNVLVQIYDDDSLMNWTSTTTNALYAALLTDGTTTQANNVATINLKPSSSYFTSITTKQVRVTYTLAYS
jgi:hypothetical protein